MENFDDGYTYRALPSGWYIGCLLQLLIAALQPKSFESCPECGGYTAWCPPDKGYKHEGFYTYHAPDCPRQAALAALKEALNDSDSRH